MRCRSPSYALVLEFKRLCSREKTPPSSRDVSDSHCRLDRRPQATRKPILEARFTARAEPQCSRCGRPHCRVEISPEIVGVLDSNAESQERRRKMFLTRYRGSSLHGCFHRTEARGVADEPDVSAHAVGDLTSS